MRGIEKTGTGVEVMTDLSNTLGIGVSSYSLSKIVFASSSE